MPGLIVVVLAVIAAIAVLAVLGFALHLLLSPWLLVAVAIVAIIKFRPGRTRR